MKVTAKELRELVAIRPGVTSDAYGFSTILGDYKYLKMHGKRVLDIGGNIGAFAVLAGLEGAKEVWSFEPELENFMMLEKNTARWPNIHAYRAAIVPTDTPEVPFYLTNGAAADGYSTIEFRGRRKVMVPAFHYQTIVEHHRPDIIKMDIEGGEWELLHMPVPLFVKDIVVELHFSKKKFRDMYDETVALFADWEPVRAPKNTGKNFHTIAHWRRP